jgi:hypothetical protein
VVVWFAAGLPRSYHDDLAALFHTPGLRLLRQAYIGMTTRPDELLPELLDALRARSVPIVTLPFDLLLFLDTVAKAARAHAQRQVRLRPMGR